GADGAVSVGEDAVRLGRATPEGFVEEVTEWLGDGTDHRVNGWSVTGEVLFAHVLAAIVRQAATSGEELGRVTLAHPDSWTPARVAALRDAAGFAGIVDVEVVAASR